MAFDYQIIVIGAGAGGLVVAIGSAKAGKRVLLIEKGNYGGDCTNFGCIPSKSLIASAHTAHSIRTAERHGISLQNKHFDPIGALQRTRDIVSHVREEEEPPALEKHGVATLTGFARFLDPHTLEVERDDGTRETVSGASIVIATGSYPFIPPIDGLASVPYLTNETIFDLEEIPSHLIVVGGGPIGCELSQAFRRLGAEVTIIQSHSHLLPRDEPEAQELIERLFREEGIHLKLPCKPTKVERNGGEIIVTCGDGEHLRASHLLISAGRRPTIEKLGLDQAGVKTYKKGIDIDDYGRTSQKHIWAIGDCNGYAPFTHMAEYEGRAVLFNLLAPWPFRKKLKELFNFPYVTYTDPEVAAIGLKEAQAIDIYGKKKIKTYFFPFTALDRAIITGRTEGFVKVVTKKWSSHILGATICAPRAGEMLLEISTAMNGNIPFRKLGGIIHPYPTYSLAIRKAADKWLTETILPLFKR